MAAVLMLLLLFLASCCGRVRELPHYIHNLEVRERRFAAPVRNQPWGPDPVPTPVLPLQEAWSLIPSALVPQLPTSVYYKMMGLFLAIMIAVTFTVAVLRKICEYLRMRDVKKKTEENIELDDLNQQLPTTSSTSDDIQCEPAPSGNEPSTNEYIVQPNVGPTHRQVKLPRCIRRNKTSRERRRKSNRRGGIFSSYRSSSMASGRSPVSESVIAKIWKTKPTAAGGGFLIGEEVNPEQIMPVAPRTEDLQSSSHKNSRVIVHTAQVHSADEIPQSYEYALRLPPRHVDGLTTTHATPSYSDQVVPSSPRHVAKTSGRDEAPLSLDHVVPTFSQHIA